ncbi:hypothetical protein GQ457_02G028170 [Hibiscus cannabinus]
MTRPGGGWTDSIGPSCCDLSTPPPCLSAVAVRHPPPPAAAVCHRFEKLTTPTRRSRRPRPSCRASFAGRCLKLHESPFDRSSSPPSAATIHRRFWKLPTPTRSSQSSLSFSRNIIPKRGPMLHENGLKATVVNGSDLSSPPLDRLGFEICRRSPWHDPSDRWDSTSAAPVTGDSSNRNGPPDHSNPRVLILEMVICPFERDGAKSSLDSDQPTMSLICPFNQGPRSFEPEGASPGDGDLSIRTRWALDPSNPRVLVLEMVICPFERDGVKSRLDSDQPTLSLICSFNQGLRFFEPEGGNPGDGDLSI